MIIPVRCFSCGKVLVNDLFATLVLGANCTTIAKVVGDLWERYLQLLDEGIADG